MIDIAGQFHEAEERLRRQRKSAKTCCEFCRWAMTINEDTSWYCTRNSRGVADTDWCLGFDPDDNKGAA